MDLSFWQGAAFTWWVMACISFLVAVFFLLKHVTKPAPIMGRNKQSGEIYGFAMFLTLAIFLAAIALKAGGFF